MGIVELALIGVGLSMDAFAVSVCKGLGMKRLNMRQAFVIALFFGGFQALMPVIGWALGSLAAVYIRSFDHWVAFALLSVVGGKAVWEALRGGEDGESRGGDPTRGMSLVVLSLATSMDAMAVGLSFAMLGINVFYPALVIGVIAGCLTLFGMVFGGWLGARFGRVMEVLGGLVLIGIGLKILVDHVILNAA